MTNRFKNALGKWRRYLFVLCAADVPRSFADGGGGGGQNRRPLDGQWACANFVILIEPYPSPRRRSGHQLFETGRSGYAEEDDHE
jgi:hypothetical protein